MPRSSTLQDEIRTLVDSFTEALTTLVKRSALEQVVGAFGGLAEDAPAPRRRGRPAGSGRKAGAKARRGSRGRRSGANVDEMMETLLAHVKANPGQRGEQIAAALRSDVGTIRLPMKKLIAAKQVRTEGQRRGMTYHPGKGKTSSKSTKGRKAASRGRGAKKGRRSKAGRRGKRAARAKAMTTTVPATDTKQAA